MGPTFLGYKPNVKESDGNILISTYLYFNYDSDVLDFNNHLSASTVKAKMKLADSIYPLLDLPERGEMMTCAEMNAKGRSLTFVEDKVYSWGGISWEYSGGLQWTL